MNLGRFVHFAIDGTCRQFPIFSKYKNAAVNILVYLFFCTRAIISICLMPQGVFLFIMVCVCWGGSFSPVRERELLQPGFLDSKSTFVVYQLCDLTDYLTFIGLHFPICKMEKITLSPL